MSGTRLLSIAAIVGGVAFAAFGGEYSTIDWWKLRHSVRAEQHAVADLEREIDSLAVIADAIERDSATQERVAREAFGMLRTGEKIYRVIR